jgi:hypothetical protein
MPPMPGMTPSTAMPAVRRGSRQVVMTTNSQAIPWTGPTSAATLSGSVQVISDDWRTRVAGRQAAFNRKKDPVQFHRRAGLNPPP